MKLSSFCIKHGMMSTTMFTYILEDKLNIQLRLVNPYVIVDHLSELLEVDLFGETYFSNQVDPKNIR